MFGKREFAARSTQPIDHLNGHDIRRADRFLALRDMPVNDLVELEVAPKPMGQPDVAERPRIGPPHRFQADPYDVRVVRQLDVVIVGEQTELTPISLPVVKDDGTLPAACLVVVQFPEMCDDSLPRPGLGADALHQRVVSVRLAVPGAVIAPEEHGRLRRPDRMTRSDYEIKIQTKT